MKTWLITGASRGFGLEIARQALSRGDQVIATARDPKSIDDALADLDAGSRLLTAALDVTDGATADAAVQRGVDHFGRIDVLVNNAGYGILGAVEEIPDADVRAVFDVNVFGLLNVTRSVLPVMRGRRSGWIVNISSVAGFTGSPAWGIYAASKFAVEGHSEALRSELAPLGVHVTIVEPGYFRTDFLDSSSLRTTPHHIPDYAATAGASRERAHAANHAQPGDPARAAAAIVDLSDHTDPPLRLQLGADCVQRVEDKLRTVRAELDTWRHVAEATAYPH